MRRGRFDPPPEPPDRVEQIMSDMLVALERLDHPALPPQVTVEPTPVTLPDVQVPTEGLVAAISRALREAVEQLPEPPAPQVNLDGLTADVDLTGFIEVAEQQREVLDALREKIANLTGGRGHFDGRLRTRDGHVVDTSHPLPTVPAVSTEEVRLDYDVRTDSQPVYIGTGTQGLATSSSEWVVQRLEYDGSDRLTRVQVLTGAWDDRATLGWS